MSLANIGVQVSIPVPQADIQTSWGVIWGQVVGESWSGPMQVNNVTYAGNLPGGSGGSDSAAVDTPASFALLVTGLVAVGWLRRRRA